MKVLITCETLSARGGTELYVRDVAGALLRLGHTPLVYAGTLGEVANEIRNLTVPVVARLDALSAAPDLVFGQHHLPTLAALLRFPDAPAVYVCHDWYGLNAFAPRLPRILRFVAVDETCRDRLVYEDGVEESRVVVLPHSVNLRRFAPRGPLPPRPRRALVFGNYTQESPHLEALRAACSERGVQLDAVGGLMRNAVAAPEELLRDYDLVFAKGRAALEAVAVGAAVVIYSGVRYLGPMVRAEEVERLLPLNFGVRAMGRALTPEELRQKAGAEIDRYDAEDAARASAVARERAGQDAAMHAVAELCEEVVEEYGRIKSGLDPRDEGPAVAAYLERLLAQQEQVQAHFRAQQQGLQNSFAGRLSARLQRYPRLAGMLRPLARALAR
ncbi:MAG TPA: glycosyltransferase family 4 protein [Pyrinomonadaceae bacterium]|nr:glycosyltransferase family 4 protein [Pyrinomonadaceae bacterium]